MKSMGELDPLLIVEGQIQDRIADFLLLKNKLVKLTTHSILTISGKAKTLLETQRTLEDQLSTNLEKVKIFKSGSWSLSDVTALGGYAYQIEKQINDVKVLEAEAAKTGQSSGQIDGMMYMVLGGFVAGAYLLYEKWNGKKK